MPRAPTEPELLTDDAELDRFLRRDPELHLYELGDLDPSMRPRATFHGRRDERGELSAVSLVYDGGEDLTWLLLGRADPADMAALIADCTPVLGQRLYVHAAPVLEGALDQAGWQLRGRSEHHKMALRDPAALAAAGPGETIGLTVDDRDEVLAFFARTYPGNWFDPRMLASGRYVGVRQDGRLVAVAGVHVWSPSRRVAALGNIATDPELRGRGFARRVTAAVCRLLIDEVDTIGLNVAADNTAAIACYRRLGFVHVADYTEGFVTR